MKRVFLIVLDSFGIGELPDAKIFGDEGSDTFKALKTSKKLNINTLINFGINNITGVATPNDAVCKNPIASYAKMGEKSMGKDTTVGHFEIAGLISESPLPTYPNGFPSEVISEFEKLTGKKTVCNKPYSGTEVIKDYGAHHVKTGDLIVYTSADSVFQIAAHESVVPVSELYNYCEIARKLLVGKHGVGRVIARPFTGEYPYVRTANRHDYSLLPPKKTMLNLISESGLDVIGVGKIYDIFAGSGITKSIRIKSNENGMEVTKSYLNENFNGLCFVNLVDFDAVYGHRNDIDGYANALTKFDIWLGGFYKNLKPNDILIITGDHGCDPSTPSTDHSREYTPMLIYGNNIKNGVNLGVRSSFSDISATVLEYLGVSQGETAGESFLSKVLK